MHDLASSGPMAPEPQPHRAHPEPRQVDPEGARVGGIIGLERDAGPERPNGQPYAEHRPTATDEDVDAPPMRSLPRRSEMRGGST